MPNYVLNQNTDSNGCNEVHKETCAFVKLIKSEVSLGWHANSVDAVAYAKAIGWKNADGCYFCCEEAHNK